jgi:serine/threonine-protein kinase
MTTSEIPTGDTELDAIIAAYVEAVERGETPDRAELLARHPQFNKELDQFFADFESMRTKRGQSVENAAAVPSPNDPRPGTVIAGRYKLLENIGEGGMGSVWVAEQQPIRRKVAIKLIKAGMDSKHVLARFEAERQALALMDHPHIAKVFDGGMTDQGRPFFVMEYVKGVPITSYCDAARLPLQERLKLFVPVCHAVQHAHQKGIVHRDLKPSNILVCLYDGQPVPKVIDFGLAKALHQQLTELSLFTGHGVMVGTPLYMSPEQAEVNNLDVDTRTDIYSLGVVLYELLTGTTPLERDQLQKAAYNEILRLIKEVEPPRPSLRLSGLDTLPTIAAQRNIDPRHLQRSVAGDLDWIVMRALEKERNRRYETANGLARDIERFLNEEAVEACPPSTWYRLRKFARKHRGQTIAASLILTSLAAGIIATTWGLVRARSAEQAAEQSEARAVRALGEVTREQRKTAAALDSEARQRELAERELCEGILRPIGYGDPDDVELRGLSEAELRAYADWSALPESRLKLKILEIALSDPEKATRLAKQSEYAQQACVALSPRRRDQVVKLLTAKQRDPSVDAAIRTSACWLAMILGSDELPALEEAIRRNGRYWISAQAEGFSSAQVIRIGNRLLAVIQSPNKASGI